MTHSSLHSHQEMVPVGKEASVVLAAMHCDCFSEEERWGAEAFSQILSVKGTSGWIVRCTHEPVGLLIVREVVGEYEVLTFGIRSAWQGRGIGRYAMMFFLKNVVSKKATVFLEVKMSNTAAFRLYSSLGFTQVGCRKRYYLDGSDARVLRFAAL